MMVGVFLVTLIAGCSPKSETVGSVSSNELDVVVEDSKKTSNEKATTEEEALVAVSEEVIELFTNDFEVDKEGWTNRGDARIELSSAQASTGSMSMLVNGRTQNWEGAQYDALDKLEGNQSYRFKVYVYFEGDAGTKEAIKLTTQQTVDGSQGWDTVAEVEVEAGQWTLLEGDYNLVTTGSITEYLPYIEAANADLAFYVDDFSLSSVGSGGPPVAQGSWGGIVSDFENEDHGWLPRMGGETLTLVDVAHNGNKSLQVRDRAQPYEGIKIPLLDKMVTNESYDIEAWVYQESGSSKEIIMTMAKDEGSPTYTRLGGANTTSGEWAKISTTYTLVENGTITDLTLYFEADNVDLVFNLDDVTIKPAGPVVTKEVQMDLPSIYKAYEDHFSVGVAIGDQFLRDSQMKDLIGLHFNSITAENSMKAGPMLDDSSRGDVYFLMADQYNAYAKKIDAGLRGHALVWHQQTPDWFFKEDFSDDGALVTRDVMLERVDAYIEKVAGRYNDSSLYAWDVVNEAIDENQPDNMRRSLWYEVIGPDFVEKVFESARKHTQGSDVQLFYNDYSVVSSKKKRMAIYDLCMDLKAKGLIDGVGLQSHISIFGPGANEFAETIQLFGEAGLDVHITELDISVYENDSQTFEEVPEELLISQAYAYKELFEVFVEYSEYVSNVTVWGLLDSQSWLNYFPITRKNWPLIFDGQYQAKYAYYGLTDPSKLPEAVNLVTLREPAYETVAKKGTPTIDGTVNDSWSDSNVINVNEFLQGESGATAKIRTMYDESYLYVLAEVTDTTPNNVSENPWEQDSIEIFIDEDFARSSIYEDDDVQYRVSMDNVVSLNGGPEVSKFISKTSTTDTGYVVTMSIPFLEGSKSGGSKIGFDVQVNDDQGSGKRDAFTKWNDITDNGWKSTEGFGTLIFE